MVNNPHSWRVSGDAPAVYSVGGSFRISAQLINDGAKMGEKYMDDDKVKKVAGKVWGLTKSTVAAGKSGVEKAKPHVKRLADTSVQATKKTAEKTTEIVAEGVHRVMGSDEYKREAENVNRRLLDALRTLEDSIKRRDRDIADLQNQVTELTAKLNGQGNG